MDISEETNWHFMDKESTYRKHWIDGMRGYCLERADGSTCGRDRTDDMHTNRTDRVQKWKRMVESLQRNTLLYEVRKVAQRMMTQRNDRDTSIATRRNNTTQLHDRRGIKPWTWRTEQTTHSE
eukprot:1259883-Heterocapsa_arctica.AAC.1